MTVLQLFENILKEFGYDYQVHGDQLRIALTNADRTHEQNVEINQIYALLKVNYTDFVTRAENRCLFIYTY